MSYDSKEAALNHAKELLADQGIYEPLTDEYDDYQAFFQAMREYNFKLDRILGEMLNGRIKR